jgi:hypothetical protein
MMVFFTEKLTWFQFNSILAVLSEDPLADTSSKA